MTTNTRPPSRASIKRSLSIEGLALAALLVLPVLLYGAARSGSELLTILLLGLMALLMVGLIVLE